MAWRNAWSMLGLLVVGQIAMSSGSYLWGPLAPFLVAELSVSKAQFGAVQSAFYVVGALMAVPAGVLADRFDGRWLLLACLLAMAIPLAVLSAAKTLLAVTLLAGLCGLGNGAINQVGARGVLHWFPPQQRATAMGLRQTGNMLGAALAAAALPSLALGLGWRAAVFLVAAGAGLAAVLSGLLYRERPVDLTSTPAAARPGLRAVAGQLFSNRPFVRLLLLAPFIAYAQIAMTTFFVLFLTDRQGVSAAAAGSLLSGALLAAALGRVAWGVIADRFFTHSRSRCLALVMALTAAAAAGLALLPVNGPLVVPALIGLLYGFCAMGWQGLLMVVIAESVGIAVAGTAVGVLINVAWGGFVLGPVVFGALADGPGYGTAWTSVAGVSALCAVALWLPAPVSRPAA
ncbi:MAG: MFS transporter [Immundisolibacter sp.]|uniref:MFS transporter n=1 Tax=Immundisolibacter sp. TaxID=1934948 RepID=UPI003EE117BB